MSQNLWEREPKPMVFWGEEKKVLTDEEIVTRSLNSKADER